MSLVPSSRFLSYNTPLHLDKEDLLSRQAPAFSTHLPENSFAKTSHIAAHYLSIPWRLCIRCVAYTIEPLPGKNKNIFLLKIAVRVSAIAGAILLLPFAIPSFILSLPFHLYSHSKRPMISIIHNEKAAGISVSHPDSLTVRTHNLGFVYEFFRVVGDLRDVKTRAHEIADWIDEDKERPEIIFFQEGFHIDGSRELCNRLKEQYPYVIHSIAPHVLGLNNGGIIASLHPIDNFSYRPFDDMLGPEKWSTRGLLKIRIIKNGKKIDVYGTHLQALLGKERAKIRNNQMTRINEWITEDQETDKADTVLLLGDLNASKLTAWGEKNDEDDALFQQLEGNYSDIFLNDHDEYGIRTTGSPTFNTSDTPEGVEAPLEEPSGSWYLGPFANKGFLLKIKELYEKHFNKTQEKEIVKTPPKSTWGTKEWSSNQNARTARFDYILRYKPNGEDDKAEIRRVKVKKETQSAPSDHAPVDAVIRI
jgi:endonuclease/exonuclease/phosphatase family metal-dependent hydrolase